MAERFLSVTFLSDETVGDKNHAAGTTTSLPESIARGLGRSVTINGVGAAVLHNTAAQQAAGQALVSKDGILRDLLPLRLNKAQAAMASPPTVTVSTSATGISGGRLYPMWQTGNNSFPYVGASLLSVGTPAASAQVSNNVTTNAGGTAFQSQSHRYLFEFDGTQIEFQTPGTGGKYWIKINDEYVDAAGVSVAADATVRYVTVTFASRTQCRIEFVSYYQGLNAVAVDATAGLYPAARRGPRCIMVGDSFNGTADSYPRIVADMLGWDDVWNSGVGGTGIVATNGGAAQSFEQRFSHDVIAYAPKVCWIVGSVNDDSSSPDAVIAALQRMRAAYLSAVPDGIFVWSPNASNGPSTWVANKNLIRWGIKSAISALANTFVVDPLEQAAYTRDALPSGQLRGAASVGNTTLSVYGQQNVGGWPQPGSTIRIDDETIEVKSSAFAGSDSGRYYFTVQIDGTVKQAHAAGAAWTTLGASYITGSGSAANPTGYGSSDVYRISAADIHPTAAGQIAFAKALAAGLFALKV